MIPLRFLIVGLGVQGKKRKKIITQNNVITVDPFNSDADYKNIYEVPLNTYDAALLCIPDEPKVELATFLLQNKKHVLIEKPLFSKNINDLISLKKLAEKQKTACYTAYNHRFEPHFKSIYNKLKSNEIGKVYTVRLFYGNGTSLLVKNSEWRDAGLGVLPDLGSHLLDTINYWFKPQSFKVNIQSGNSFENQSLDHVILNGTSQNKVNFNIELTLLSWRNSFYADIIGENGSLHIESLCKWGPSRLISRKRIFPSGRPIETSIELIQEDPTWEREFQHFISMCLKGENNLQNDIWVCNQLNKIGQKVN